MKKIFLLAITIIFMLVGCNNKENIKISDLEGYWVDEHIYENELGVDKVIEFTDSEEMVVYSYYDKGIKVYELEVEESTSDKITFSIDDGDEVIDLEKVDDEKYKYRVDDEELYIVKIDESEAEKFIQVIDENSEY